MGLSTQLFVTAEIPADDSAPAHRYRIGRTHPWRYGPHMAICAAQAVEHLTGVIAYRDYHPSDERAEGVAAIYSVNRATFDASGLSLRHDVSTRAATECHNNMGAFLVNLCHRDYTFGFLLGPATGGDLATVTGIDGLMQAFGTDWGATAVAAEDTTGWTIALRHAVATLRAAEADGHLMDQHTAHRVTAAAVPQVPTRTMWDTLP